MQKREEKKNKKKLFHSLHSCTNLNNNNNLKEKKCVYLKISTSQIKTKKKCNRLKGLIPCEWLP